MRVCFINAWGNGSTGRLVEMLANKCRLAGDECISFYGRGSSYLDDAICYNSKINLYGDVIFSRMFDNQGLNSKCVTKRIIRHLNEFNPDIIHIHNLHGYWINYRLLFNYINENNIKVIWTLHDSWPLTGHCACYSYLNCERFNKGCGECPGIDKYPVSFVDRSKNNLAIKMELFSSVRKLVFVAPSEWMKKNVEGSCLKHFPTIIIRNQIDNSIFFYRNNTHIKDKLGIDPKKKIVLYVAMSTTDPWKGFSILKQTIEMLPSNYHTIIIGDCDLNNSKDVTVLGRVSDPNVLAEIYSISDVLANPSLDDNYPTVNIEALACGLPVAGFETGGIPEQVDDNSGCLTKEKNAQSLLNSILYLSNQDRECLRENCINKYMHLSCSDSCEEQYYALYRDWVLEN